MRVACRRPGTAGATAHKITVPARLGVILMANEFEWHTDVDGGWEPQAPEPAPSQRPTSRRRKLMVLAIAVGLLLAAGYGAYRMLTSRVEEATSTAERGLLMAHELLVSGSMEGDQDLVLSVVAKRPASWHDLNADLVARQLFFSRRPLGIEVIREGDQHAAEIETRLMPELDAAEVVDRRSYLADGRGMTETIMLERSFFYELTGEQWVLSPAAEERAFWGNWITDERTNISVTYPERDEEVAIRLAGYLDSFLPALCAADLDCPDDFQLTFKLERDPTSIRRLSEGVYAIRASSAAIADRLVLPAPSLVGKPVDEAGYEALERGYAGWIGTAIVARYGPSTARPEDVLARFDLQVPPTPVEPLPRPARGTFPAGVTGPDQDVLLLCSSGSLDRMLRFETATGTWQEEATGALWGQVDSATPGRSPGTSTYLSRLPNYRGVIVQTTNGQGEQAVWHSYLLIDGSARLLTEERQTHVYLPPRLQPDGQPPENLLSFYVPGDEAGEGFSSMLVNLETCPSSPCATESLPGMLAWSPDGRRTALIAPEADGNQRLYLGDGKGAIMAEVGIGQSPAWVDEDRFVYVAQGHEDPQDRLARWFGQEVRLVDAGSESPSSGHLLFDAETLRQAISVEKRPDNLTLWTVQPAMPGSGWWYVTARGDWKGQRMDYFLVYDQAATEIRLAIPLVEYGLIQPPMVNAPRTQVLIVALPRDDGEMSVELISANTDEVRRLPARLPQDWSADGQWLIQLDRGLMTLVSTDSAAQWPIAHDLDSCYWAVWTKQEED